MKRKLNAQDVPEAVPVPETPDPQTQDSQTQDAQSQDSQTQNAQTQDMPAEHPTSKSNASAAKNVAKPKPSFEKLQLNSRLLQAVAVAKLKTPTPVQAAAIPAALEGKSILARSKTGSGKTLAYLLPILENILRRSSKDTQARIVTALILVPTKELAEQVHKVATRYTAFSGKTVRLLNLSTNASDAVQRSLLADVPDLVIATPGRAWAHVESGALQLEGLAQLVVDEADLVLSYGYEQDLKNIAPRLPERVQTLLMSATLTPEVDTVRSLFCPDPLILEIDESEEEATATAQYVIKCSEDEKFLYAFIIFKLGLVKGKTIIFVGDTDRAYRLRLFLEQFGIRSCVLNAELPVNSRLHVVEEFNKSVYNILIAADDQETMAGELPATSSDAAAESSEKTSRASKSHSKKKRRSDKEFGIARGIDFYHVACVLNFDLPPTAKAYTHRIGRTARAGRRGMALSFVLPRSLYRKHLPTSFAGSAQDEAILAKIMQHQSSQGKTVQDYHFSAADVAPFRYRFNDALRAVTPTTIRAARARELRQELLRSEKLQRHFEENPDDLRHLRHDQEIRAARLQPHLRHVPDYLMPQGRAQQTKSITQTNLDSDGNDAETKGHAGNAGSSLGFVGFRKTSENRIRKARALNRAKGKVKRGTEKKANPLKSFNMRGRGK